MVTTEERKDISFVMISSEFLFCMRYMSPQATMVWTILLSYWFFKKGSKTKRINEFVFPSKRIMELKTGISENTISKIIDELKILGFIKKVEKRFVSQSSANLSNYYYLNDHPEITQAKLDELVKFRNVKRAKVPLTIDEYECELYGENA